MCDILKVPSLLLNAALSTLHSTHDQIHAYFKQRKTREQTVERAPISRLATMYRSCSSNCDSSASYFSINMYAEEEFY